MFDIGSEKSPGPDGMTDDFYQKYWHIVGPTVTRAVKSFYITGKILKQLNHTFIALLPKVDNPIRTANYRPISLCSTVYKIIAKILANRLSSILPKLIHPLQSAFTKNRAIHDNVLIAHEIFHGFRSKKGKEGYMAIKLDMEKAYDKLEWNFIKLVLQHFGFSEKFRKWINECITTVSYSILINDSPTTLFLP